ncbi:YitT family protein [Limosilactobacillus mucosae]|uniref:YitT family protein n=1 Tax=Limosilactobacillus mucosae TaxID=97478 RepID=UPI0023B15325|nr:YitT family protein [Limosilactobacillus mucosae]MDE8677976.1 YitT family protein [Limosilactobacillus mucosae]
MSSNAKKRDQKILIKIAVALCYGVLSAMAINMFLSHANSYSVGLLGGSQLLQALFLQSGLHISMSLLVAVLNVPLFVFAWYEFGFSYILFSMLAVGFNVVFLKFIPTATLVNDPLTNTIIGAAILGIGIGLCFNQGFTTGGSDIVVTYCQKKLHKKVGMLNNLINGAILVVTVLCFGPSRIVYSLIGMLVTSLMMDHTFVLQEDVSVTIYTKKSAAVAEQLRNFVHGATLLHGTGVYTNEPTDIILVCTPKAQLNELRKMVHNVDPDSFISISRADVEFGNYQHYSF